MQNPYHRTHQPTKKNMNHLNKSQHHNHHTLSMFSHDRHSTKFSELKQRLGHQLTFMLSRDLLPFFIVENEESIFPKLHIYSFNIFYAQVFKIFLFPTKLFLQNLKFFHAPCYQL